MNRICVMCGEIHDTGTENTKSDECGNCPASKKNRSYADIHGRVISLAGKAIQEMQDKLIKDVMSGI